MTSYESKIKTIYNSADKIFSVLSDLNNLARIKDRIPQDKIKEITFDTDCITINTDMGVSAKLVVIDREPSKTIKFALDGVPIEANMWIQLKEVAENDTKIKITIKVKLNLMLKMMVKNKIPEFLNSFADGLTRIDYSSY